MKQPVNEITPQRDSVCFLDHYEISAEDLAAFAVEDAQRAGERRRDRRQRRLARERMRSGGRP